MKPYWCKLTRAAKDLNHNAWIECAPKGVPSVDECRKAIWIAPLRVIGTSEFCAAPRRNMNSLGRDRIAVVSGHLNPRVSDSESRAAAVTQVRPKSEM